MPACYIVTYYLKGPCAVNVNTIASKIDEPGNHCVLTFNDGSRLRLEEACEAVDKKAPLCTPQPAPGLPVFG